MQNGDVEVRAGLFEELKTEIPELTKSKFAHFFVLKVSDTITFFFCHCYFNDSLLYDHERQPIMLGRV
jgi:hypothetical protein